MTVLAKAALPPVSLHEICEDDALEVLEFESCNSTFFEKWLPARKPEYFEEASLRQAIRDLIKDPDKFYLIRSQDNELVGRINIRNLDKAPLDIAELGYRVGEKHLGKGYARAAVASVIEQVHTEGSLTKLEAFAADSNPASSNVLLACGFIWDEAETKIVKLHGNSLKLQRYVLDLQSKP